MLSDETITMKGLWSQYVHVTVVVISYWTVSIFTVFINKILLSGSFVNLDAPLFMTWFQCVVSAFLCFSLSCLGKRFPSYIKFPSESPFKRELVVKVIPLSVLFTLMITFNNLCLKYVDVGFYYIGRSLTTVFNVVLSYVILGQRTSVPTLICCAIIVGGFWQGVVQEDVAGSLSISGMVFGILSSLFLSLYSIYTKRVLPFVNQEIWLLSYCNNVYSIFLFLPLIIINKEIPEIFSYSKLNDMVFWTLMCLGGVCGFAIGFVTALQIKVTSPLTHNISATAKSCAQTVLASYIYQEIKPWAWWLSNWVVLAGSAAYTWVKQREMEASRPASVVEIHERALALAPASQPPSTQLPSSVLPSVTKQPDCECDERCTTAVTGSQKNYVALPVPSAPSCQSEDGLVCYSPPS